MTDTAEAVAPAVASTAVPVTPPAAGGAAAALAGDVKGTETKVAGPSWLGEADAELAGYVQNKGWKSPVELLNSYKGLEKLAGAPADKILRLPDEGDDAGWNDVLTKLGRPATPEEYKIEVPPEVGDEKFAAEAKGWMHKAGLTAKQAEAIAGEWNAAMKARVEEQQAIERQQAEAFEKKSAEDLEAIARKLGPDQYAEAVEYGRRAVRHYGLKEEQLTALERVMGTEAFTMLLSDAGRARSEAKFVGSEQASSFTMSRAQALAKIDALKADKEWQDRYLNGGAKERDEFERLNKVAYG